MLGEQQTSFDFDCLQIHNHLSRKYSFYFQKVWFLMPKSSILLQTKRVVDSPLHSTVCTTAYVWQQDKYSVSMMRVGYGIITFSFSGKSKKTEPLKRNSWGIFPSQKPQGISKCGNNIICSSWKNKHFLFYAQGYGAKNKRTTLI